MPLVGGRVIGLGLRAQHLLHHLRAEVGITDPVEDMVERRRADHLAEREGHVERLEIVLQRDELFAAGRFVDAIHHRRLLRFQRLGGGDVGGDHIILDQPRLTRIARLRQRAPAGPERTQHVDHRTGIGVDRRLCLFISEVRRGADAGAGEAPAFKLARFRDVEMADQGGAVLAFLQ
ncbi:hypothetical protein WR25_10397 [Diploscapter pachys]|uniref:Uncharacterized protein n=1 Tax=Diploscapter pachys TaxID=2018661 RepID=A0A2A2JZF0_9BILA|nr:hypothetical protein WR25_10397 [Diploscapter pachys]